MKHVAAFFGLSLTMLPVCTALAAVEKTSLYNKQFLWHELESSLLKPTEFASTKAELKTINNDQNIQYKLVKSVGKGSTYDHYQAYFNNQPILGSNLVVARNSNGSIRQTMGKLLSGSAKAKTAVYHDVMQPTLEQTISELSVLEGAKIVDIMTAYTLIDGDLLPVIQVKTRLHGRSERWVLDGNNLAILSKQDDTLYAVAPDSLQEQGYQVGGGIGGNTKLGAICFSPSPSSMSNCTSYQYDSYNPVGQELLFEDLDRDAIFAEFNGFPFVIKKENGNCILENPYVTTFDMEKSETEPASYVCQQNNENFVKSEIDTNYNARLSYSAVNEGHFNGGLVMQFFHKKLRELFPNQSVDCSSSGYCIKPLQQKVNHHTIFGSNFAWWDGAYVNYGPGDNGYQFYSFTGLGIVAHEVGHAITEWNSAIGANSHIDYAINEGLSDIAALAALDYFQHAASGAYTQSQSFVDMFIEQQGQYSTNRKWWYGWDIVVGDHAMRYFELPSWDGRSIDHWKDFTSAKTGHDNGGVLRKAFYELVKTHNWSIQQAYNLFLRANASQCLFAGMTINEFGFCLIDQASHITVDNKAAEEVISDIADSLAGVGISTGIGLSTLDADIWLNYNTVNYDLSRLNPGTITQIEVHWGDGQIEKWHQSDNTAIYPFLKRKKVLAEDQLVRFALHVTTVSGTTSSAFKHFFTRKAEACAPYMTNDVLYTDSISFGGHEFNGLPAGYTPYITSPFALATKQDYTINFSQDLTGKLLDVFFDYNKNGKLELDENIVSEQRISGKSASFNINQQISPGMGVLRIAISTGELDYYIWDGCGLVDNSQVLDVMLDMDSVALPIIANFGIEYLEGNRVKFTNSSQVNPNKAVSYLWQFGFDNKTSRVKEPSIIEYPEGGGQFDVSLQVSYDDNSDLDTKSNKVYLAPIEQCPAKIRYADNAGVLYIDELKLFNYNTELAILPSAPGYNPQGYSKAVLENFSMDHKSNLSLEVMTNLIPRSTAESLLNNSNRGIRFTIWLDENRDGVFSADESSFGNDPNYDYWLDNSTCRTLNDQEYCQIKAIKSINLPRLPWYDRSKNFDIRAKIEEHPQYSYKKDACNLFDYGEIHDLQLKVTR
ncbi:M4 family metallopeptidase [Pseudoalteromonas luteoviolacea]|uniref:Uncharacterized protein n=1 Tax=Pseudoalteromonas luteoviolacea H33 TaxID=1365251 RepID=A0A167EQR8_9GAMM|nr:M4 family metallopeptidase [Pseudoalteromonas luteoviolacea]KZN51086.1 hypothetical protein N476_14420 [Pseudoalteromonas luteoviolacea H33]KZN72121.1 hypothetical protein N477_03005 [Pseudoalteromonas luteoviolacea H33-S]